MLSRLFTPRSASLETVATVDLGSNSFHMIVANVSDGNIHVVDKLREMVRLAAGLDEQKNISQEAQDRAIACLERFGQRLRAMPAGSVRAVGTNTLRSAHNAEEFLNRAEAALGHPIDIIAGREEARLIYLGVAHGMDSPPQEQCLVMDIGGGSTEFIIGEGFETRRRESLYMGCVTMSQRWFGNGKITAKNMRRAEISALSELQPIAAEYRARGWQRVIGASGTIKAIGKVVEAEGWSDEGITPKALKKLREALVDMGEIDKISLKDLKSERFPVFPGGVAVLSGAFEALKIEHMTVSDSALREGLVYEMLGRFRQEDIRTHTIKHLQKRYNIDTEQAKAVSDTARLLLEKAAEDWNLEIEAPQRLLCWAAQLHEMGLIVAHNQYHKHGEYLLLHSDLAGFSRQEQTLLATLVRAHRRKLPTDSFNSLPENDQLTALRLCILLRIAVLLNRNRSHAPMPEFHLTAKKSQLNLAFPEDWLQAHPLTQDELENEQHYLSNTGIELVIESYQYFL
ncbi:exopolyphosphatase [Candidatus Venteria ishoeyi]|uniref:Exopolyphosphatase n=1 Tax=Candidatus Venteria ishoeyi TaxID=1899563 RepID=A0A1H6F7Y9_9GAMM|nr:exopolyphosphatase [Candidatus Venteria ishoeyi]MDM8547237.1 exopolyphosphatase [Candidatus Venteria ishoeyi]SEH05184.1 Exopolyphosphatase [Candidatus Venteria ishoeyi]